MPWRAGPRRMPGARCRPRTTWTSFPAARRRNRQGAQRPEHRLPRRAHPLLAGRRHAGGRAPRDLPVPRQLLPRRGGGQRACRPLHPRPRARGFRGRHHSGRRSRPKCGAAGAEARLRRLLPRRARVRLRRPRLNLISARCPPISARLSCRLGSNRERPASSTGPPSTSWTGLKHFRNTVPVAAQGSRVTASRACWKSVRSRMPSGREAGSQPGPQAATTGGRGRVLATAASWS